MSPSSISLEDFKEKASESPAPSQDYGDEPGSGHHDRIWLTLRRRCELCKQRKVRADPGVSDLRRAPFRKLSGPSSASGSPAGLSCRILRPSVEESVAIVSPILQLIDGCEKLRSTAESPRQALWKVLLVQRASTQHPITP
jgi:hypothetical protein